jgi:hypothetical protein
MNVRRVNITNNNPENPHETSGHHQSIAFTGSGFGFPGSVVGVRIQSSGSSLMVGW